MTKKIIDVSKYQGHIEWPKLVGACDGAILKATDGNTGIDETFFYNWNEASKVGLLRGAYHFAQPDTRQRDAKQEAEHFVGTLLRAGYKQGTPMMIALDIEKATKIDKGLAFVRWVLDFCERVDELTGVLCGIYTGGPFWNEHDGDPDEDTRRELSRRWLWIAAYVNDPTRFIQMTPWRDVGATMHQFSGDVGPGGKPGLRYPGITANVVDTNYFLRDADLDNWIDSLRLDYEPITFPDPTVIRAEQLLPKLVDP